MFFKKGDERVYPELYPELYKCPECGSKQIIDLCREGDSVCASCGLVLWEKQAVSPEKGMKPEAYKDFYGPGQAPWSHSQESGSMFGFSKGFRDIYLNYLSPKDKAKFERLKRLHTSRGKKSIDPALTIFRNIINKIKPPQSVKLEALKIFLESLREKLISGRSYKGVIGASILIAYRMNNHLKSITELSEEISTPQKNILRCYQVLRRKLNIKVNINFRPEEFVPRFCSGVNAGMKIEKKAIEIIKEFQDKVNTSGKDPKGIAVAAIYFVSEIEYKKNPENYIKITQKELASAGSITEVTLRSRYKEIKTALSST